MSVFSDLSGISANLWRLSKIVTWVGAPLGLAVWLFDNLVGVEARLDDLNAELVSISGMLASSPVHSIMSKVNLIFPMTEFNAFWHAWVGLYLASVSLRWLRSLLPGGFGG